MIESSTPPKKMTYNLDHRPPSCCPSGPSLVARSKRPTQSRSELLVMRHFQRRNRGTRSWSSEQVCCSPPSETRTPFLNKRFFPLIGTGGLAAANQIYNRFKAAGKSLNAGDIAIIDPAEYHYYQPGWTLVASGLTNKSKTRRPLSSLIPSHLSHIVDSVKSFEPNDSSITTLAGRKISYDNLVVAAGLQINWNAIQGLTKALADPNSGVSSVYSYDTADKVWSDVQALRSGRAIFTQPAGVIKCAGAPQKVMWMAWSTWEKVFKSESNIQTEFYTGMPTMFAVPKYSQALDELRVRRGIGAAFGHNLVSVDAAAKKATFKKADGSVVEKEYTLLHAVPPMGPLDAIKGSPIADEVGWVNVDKNTLRHVEYGNVWSLGDSSSLPTSKTAAAITAQAPVLADNLFRVMDTGSFGKARYDGYTSCPVSLRTFPLVVI